MGRTEKKVSSILSTVENPDALAIAPVAPVAPVAPGGSGSAAADQRLILGSPSLLGLILSATNDGFMDWNLATGVIEYSERWKAQLGYEEPELPDSPDLWRTLSHPDDIGEAESLLRDHTDNLWPFAYTWRMRHKNGDWRWLLCRAVTTHDARGVANRCVCVFTDLTDQVSTERRLAELTRRSDLLLASAGEGLVGIDFEGRITFANPAALEILGHSEDGLAGCRFSQVISHGCPADRPCTFAACPILRPFSDGGAHKSTNVRFGRKSGPPVLVDFLCTPAIEQKVVVGVVLTFRDVTEQRRVEAQQMQGQKLEALGQLSAGIAHEINTPMQFIGDNVAFLGPAFSDLLKLVGQYREALQVLQASVRQPELFGRIAQAEAAADLDYLTASIPGAIASTRDGVLRVSKIVYAMKEFSHPGRTEKSFTDLNKAVECAATISANAWKHVARLELKLAPDLPNVKCHSGEINQVILNLIVNAAHAIEDVVLPGGPGVPLGTLTIETLVRAGFAEIRISDTGAGVPESVRDRLFEPFFTTKGVGRGTGQGLTLARSIVVERHGGFITFDTVLGEGTRFTVGLPLSSEA